MCSMFVRAELFWFLLNSFWIMLFIHSFTLFSPSPFTCYCRGQKCLCFGFDSEPYLFLCGNVSWQRTTSLEVSAVAHDGASDVQSCRIGPSSACTRRKGRSRSIPTELTAPSSSPYAERPAGCADSRETGAAKKVEHQNIITHRDMEAVLLLCTSYQ